MKELLRILAEAGRFRSVGQPFALATVVKIDGSTYRRPGARMLISADGDTMGTISGGCLEQEVAQQALNMMDAGSSPQVHLFDMSDDDLILGFGTGCNGVVHVLIEPIPSPGRTDPTLLVETCLHHRQTGVLAMMIGGADEAQLARRLLVLEDGSVHGNLDRPDLLEVATQTLAHGRSWIRQTDQEEILFEVVRPPVHLCIFGTGHDVMPIVRMAKEMAWTVTIVGRKPTEVLAERYPLADNHIFLMHAEQAQAYVSLDAHSAAVVMNHNYLRDRTLVGTLLKTEVGYVGALGPRERTLRFIEELKSEQPALTDTHFARLHGPIGLDIGTETPEEIALSLLAEIQAVQHQRNGGMLRERAGAIHDVVLID